MRRYGLLLMVLVLASASLLAAAAYNTAVVTNAASLTVVSTDQGLLRLTAGSDLDQTAWIGQDGELHIDFSKGWGQGHGLQPDSVYYWEDLFWIRGGSNNPVDFTVELYDAAGQPVNSSAFKISIWNDANMGNNPNGTPAGGSICYVNQNANTLFYDTNEGVSFNKGIDVRVEVLNGAAFPLTHGLQVIVKAHQ